VEAAPRLRWYLDRMNRLARLLSLARSCSSVAIRLLPETRLKSVRVRLLRFAGVRIGKDSKFIGYQVMLDLQNVVIGDGVFVSSECVFEAGGGITIGDSAMIGPRVVFLTINHFGKDNKEIVRLPITVEPFVWIGANSTICPGVTIGHHAVVGAGAVVTKDVAAHARVVGVPARAMIS